MGYAERLLVVPTTARSHQVTFWIWFWLLVIAIPDLIKTPAASMTAANLFAGITPLVWFVCFLQVPPPPLFPHLASQNLIFPQLAFRGFKYLPPLLRFSPPANT